MSLKFLDTLRQLNNSEAVKVAQQGANIAQTATQTATKALWWVKALTISFVGMCILLALNLISIVIF